MTVNIGFTGGIGSGKTTAAQLFQQRGAAVIDSDELAKDCLLPGEPVYHDVKNRYGKTVVLADNTLDRRALRQIIFSDMAEKKWLETQLHPQINQLRQMRIATIKAPYCLSVIPLLIETQLTDEFDRILVIDSDEKQQCLRASERDNSKPNAIKQIMRQQASRLTRLTAATDVLFNDQHLNHLKQQVDAFHHFYLKLAAHSQSS